MNPRNWTRLTVAFAASISLIGCGGSSSARPSTTATVGAAGATLKAGQATLTIPANALSAATQVTLREAEPQHQGRLERVEVELEHGAACSTACATGEECDDGVCKADTEDAGAKTCDPLCDTGQECDDGICKTHTEVETEHGGTGGTCSPSCASGMECDTTSGICKPSGKTP